MESTFLQELLEVQTLRFQNRGLGFAEALDAALQHLLPRACAGLLGLEALRMRARLTGAARNLTLAPPRPSSIQEARQPQRQRRPEAYQQ